MSYRIAALAAAAVMLAAGPSFAAKSAMLETRVPQSVIDAGPQLAPWEDNDSLGWANAELDYLHKVCPTVLSDPSQYRGNLATFCRETPAG